MKARKKSKNNWPKHERADRRQRGSLPNSKREIDARVREMLKGYEEEKRAEKSTLGGTSLKVSLARVRT